MKTVLLTNDDGIDAPGLSALRELACNRFGEENIWVVAPAEEMSQVGHQVTTGNPIRVDGRSERSFAIDGTPADCTRLALSEILPGKPDLVLSGINFGGNLGRHDFVISGTIAAAREAVFHGVAAISISNFHRAGVPFSWEKSSEMTAAVLDFYGESETPAPGEFWNVNLPHPDVGADEKAVIKLAHPERQPLELLFELNDSAPDSFRYAGRYHERPASPGSDVEVCFGGDIAVSVVSI